MRGNVRFVIALLALFEQDSMDVSFKMIDGNERLIDRKADGFGETQSNKQSAR